MDAVDERAVAVPNPSQQYDVVVIGGGISGLVATYRLHQRGLSVLLLELHTVLGGRCGGPADTWGIEAGAEFIHGEAASTWELLREFDLQADRFPQPSTVSRFYHLNDELVEDTQLIGRLVDCICQQVETLNLDDSRPLNVSSYLVSLDQDSLGHEFATCEPELIELAKRFAQDRIERFEGSPLEDLGSLEYSLQMTLSASGPNNYRILGGYRALVDSLSDALVNSDAVDIRLGEAVTLVDATALDSVDVRTTSGQSYSAYKVLVTVPLSILRAIADSGTEVDATSSRFGQVGAFTVIPAMDQEWVQALDGLGIGHALKVVVAIRDLEIEPFGFLHTLEAMPTWINIPQGNSDISVLLGYFGGATAVKLASKSDDELRKLSHEVLKRVLKVDESQFCDPVVVHRWDEVEAIYGTYSYPRQGGQRSAQTLAGPRGNVFFAGEALSLNGNIGTVHGAIDTAERCVAHIVESLGKRSS